MAGVSTATVSRVLNEPERVSAKTRSRVEAAVAHFDYTPHFGGRALASNRTNTVGAVIPTMENAIFARGLQALQEALAEDGVTLVVATSNYDPEREAQQIRALLGRGVDGLVLIGEARDPALYETLERRSVPFVLVWSWRRDCPWPCVGFDNRAAARAMAQKVLDLGHRRIAMIAGVTHGNDRAAARVDGVRDALAARGLRIGRNQPDRDPLSSRCRRKRSSATAVRDAPSDRNRVRQRCAGRRGAPGHPLHGPERAGRCLRDRLRRYRSGLRARSAPHLPFTFRIAGWVRRLRDCCFGCAPRKTMQPVSSSKQRWWNAAHSPRWGNDGREGHRRASAEGRRNMGRGALVLRKRHC